ncbi:hypothetical protein V1502_10950 [Bacillus sp. SCS-153A]|uniref:hypothetical protein n=1 Tax=Rossellomorea sedimentorum TaxID=3115294 RepID=UPI0039067AAD
MNINNIVRTYMAQIMNDEDFLKHVAELIERQLHEWDLDYKVYIMKLKDYEVVVKNNEQYYEVKLSNQELEVLRFKGLYNLDHRIWTELMDQGLPIMEGYGNYMETVLPEIYKS